MPLFKKQDLLSELTDRTELIISSTKSFLRFSEQQLNFKSSPEKWSISEIFDHLYITHQIYIHKIIPKISQGKDVSDIMYKCGWLGGWFYNKMMPRSDGSVFKLKTPALLKPSKSGLHGREIIERFLQQQDAIHDLIEHSAKKDLRRIRIPLAITDLIKLQLGDVFRFIIAHNERHLLQAQTIAITFLSGDKDR